MFVHENAFCGNRWFFMQVLEMTVKVKWICLWASVILTVAWFPVHAGAVSLNLTSASQTVVPGQDVKVDITVNDPAGVSGAVLSLRYPGGILGLDATPVTTNFFNTVSQSTDGEAPPIELWQANTGTRGVVNLAGLVIGDAAAGTDVLFSIHFHVNADAPAGPVVLVLQPAQICDGPAGWGTDVNNNGIYDRTDGDAFESVPALYHVATAPADENDDIQSTVTTSVLLAMLSPDPVLPLLITANDTGGGGIGGGSGSSPQGIVSPADGQVNVSLTPMLEVVAFPDVAHAAENAGIRWQISTDADFSYLVFEMTGPTDFNKLTVPALVLDPLTTYYWRALYIGASESSSGQTAVASFTTGPSPMPDADHNGLPDSQEVGAAGNLIAAIHPDLDTTNLKTLKNSTGDFQFGLMPDDSGVTIDRAEWMTPEQIQNAGAPPVDLPYGLMAFRIHTLNPGDQVHVTVYFSRFLVSTAQWWKYTPQNGWMDYASGAQFLSDGSAVRLTLTDGGPGDADGVKNGVIVEPGGPTGKISGEADSPACFITAVLPRR